MDMTFLKNYLLKNEFYDEYNDILNFMRNPKIILSAKTKFILNEIGYSDFEDDIMSEFRMSPKDYTKKYYYGHVVSWVNTLDAYVELISIYNGIYDFKLINYSDYFQNSEQVKKVLGLYAEAKSIVTKIETEHGIDRYLDGIFNREFSIITEKFNQIHRLTEEKMSGIKKNFIEKWGNFNVYDVLIHRLIDPKLDNEVCTLYNTGKKKIILFIIDGLGLGQYLWSKKVVPSNKNFFMNDNFFDFLNENMHISENVLAAPLITDTAAGLSQIFLGESTKKTRIFSSTMKKESSNYIVSVKDNEISSPELNTFVNSNYYSFTCEVLANMEQMNIYYCSKYDYSKIGGFSNLIFDSANVKSVIPPERVFSYLSDEMMNMKSGLDVVYITTIDNSGHVMGSFSQFERYEHEKINLLFKNFMINLATNNKELFDGSVSIMFTADHGMTESGNKCISKKDIMNVIYEVGFDAGKIVEANRAEFIYDISEGAAKQCKDALIEFFKENDISAKVLIKGDELFDSCIPDYSSEYINTIPDIIILLISEGLFHSRNVGEYLLHFGGHGGHSIDEVFVPLLSIDLTEDLYSDIEKRFIKKM